MTHLGVLTHGYPDGGYAVKRHLWHVTDCTPLCTCTPPVVCDTGVALFGGVPEGPHRGPQGGSHMTSLRVSRSVGSGYQTV